MPIALILAAALAAPPAPAFNPPTLVCGAQVDPKFVTYVPPAEAKEGDPLFRLVGAQSNGRLAGVPADALGCLQRLQRTRSQPAH